MSLTTEMTQVIAFEGRRITSNLTIAALLSPTGARMAFIGVMPCRKLGSTYCRTAVLCLIPSDSSIIDAR